MKSNRWYFVIGGVTMAVLAIVAGIVMSVIPTTLAVTVTPIVSNTPVQSSEATNTKPELSGTIPTTSAVSISPIVSDTPVQSSDVARSITVVGTGSVSIVPDQAMAQIGVETQAASPERATRQNDQRLAKVIEALIAAGVDEKDIQTAYFNLYSEQSYQPDTGEPTGEFTYRVSNGLSVKIRDLTNFGVVLGEAVKAGANNISGVTLSIEDTAALEATAREKAVADAQARAQSLAQLSGVQLGEVVAVSEVIGASALMLDRAGLGLGGGGGAPIQPGQLEVTVQLQVSFTITP